MSLTLGGNITLQGSISHTVLALTPIDTINYTAAKWGYIEGTLSDQTDLLSALNAKANSADLANVATSGSYADLSNKPTTIPSGGTSGQVLAKASNTDYDIEWVNGAPVTSVNSKTGAVTLSASDVGALASSTTFVSSVNGSSGAVTGLQTTANLVTSVSSTSTDTQYPSAKCLFDSFSTTARNALINCFIHVAWADSQGQSLVTALAAALGVNSLVSISAVYTQTETVTTNTPLNDLKTDLVVTATHADSSTETVPSADYMLSGTLIAGTSTVTVSYAGKTTTFNVTVTASPQLVTDGLMTYFDLRTAQYNNAASGGKTVIYSSDGNYSAYAWSGGGISEQSAQYGMKFANQRAYPVATVKDGTTAYTTGNEWTEVFLSKTIITSDPHGLFATNNISGLTACAHYTDTSDAGKTYGATSLNIGYRNNVADYMIFICRASADKYEFFDNTGQAVYTVNASDIADFKSWVSQQGFKATATTGYVTFFATYTKALSDAQVLDMVDYLKSLEVSE